MYNWILCKISNNKYFLLFTPIIPNNLFKNLNLIIKKYNISTKILHFKFQKLIRHMTAKLVTIYDLTMYAVNSFSMIYYYIYIFERWRFRSVIISMVRIVFMLWGDKTLCRYVLIFNMESTIIRTRNWKWNNYYKNNKNNYSQSHYSNTEYCSYNCIFSEMRVAYKL